MIINEIEKKQNQNETKKKTLFTLRYDRWGIEAGCKIETAGKFGLHFSLKGNAIKFVSISWSKLLNKLFILMQELSNSDKK